MNEIGRLRSANQVIFENFQRADRRVVKYAKRAKMAEARIEEIERLTAHCRMERHFQNGRSFPDEAASHS
jgi:CRISPR/Cas system-associated endonuclease Cas1